MTDLDWDEYDWRRRLSRINMTGNDLAKYDWLRRLRGGGSGHYFPSLRRKSIYTQRYFPSARMESSVHAVFSCVRGDRKYAILRPPRGRKRRLHGRYFPSYHLDIQWDNKQYLAEILISFCVLCRTLNAYQWLKIAHGLIRDYHLLLRRRIFLSNVDFFCAP